MLTALSVACAMSVSSTLPPVRLNNQVPEGDQHRRRDIRQPKVKLRHENQWQMPARYQESEESR